MYLGLQPSVARANIRLVRQSRQMQRSRAGIMRRITILPVRMHKQSIDSILKYILAFETYRSKHNFTY